MTRSVALRAGTIFFVAHFASAPWSFSPSPLAEAFSLIARLADRADSAFTFADPSPSSPLRVRAPGR